MSGLLVYMLLLGRYPVDWEGRAHERLAAQDWTGAVEAATKCIEQQEGNYDALFLRARAYTSLMMMQRALDDVERAIELNPGSSALIGFKGNLLSYMGEDEKSIEFYDETMKAVPDDLGILMMAAKARLTYFNKVSEGMVSRLEKNHPYRLSLQKYLADYYAAPREGSRHFRLLIDPLPGALLSEEVSADLDLTWRLLNDADQLMREPRVQLFGTPTARMLRAEINLMLGRLLAAKEDLQVLLKTSLANPLKIQTLDLLARVLRKLGSHEAEAKMLRERVDLMGGLESAPLTFLADMFEAEFKAAEQTASLRLSCISKLDRHLEVYRHEDIRSLGYRGVAALKWQDNAALATKYLKEVLDVLRMQRGKDPSVAEPSRARLFILTLIEAYERSNQADKAVATIATLIDLAPKESEFMILRSQFLERAGLHDSASTDLLRAMRSSSRDMKLFRWWLESASKVKDDFGDTPVDRAVAAANRWRALKAALKEELADQYAQFGVDRYKKVPGRRSRRMAAIEELSKRATERPIEAWLMAEEFGRLGETVESRNFLFRAATKEPDVMVFRYRLGQYRLDLGMYDKAAEDFETILRRDPSDGEVAELAVDAWRMAGDLERSRRVRRDVMLADPRGAGLRLAVMAALSNGDIETAQKTMEPYANQQDADMQHLRAQVMLAAGEFAEARDALRPLLASDPESATLLRDMLRALAGMDNIAEFLIVVERFVNLPRLLPSGEIEQLLSTLEDQGHYGQAAYIGNEVAQRYFEEVALAFKCRAALDALKGGNPTLLRNLRDQKLLATGLSDETVRAAFGLTLREDGPHAAAEYLRAAREFDHDADWAILPTAAAFALTPFVIELSNFLNRYHTMLPGEEVPLEDALLWWLTYSRTSKRPTRQLTLTPGAEGEITWLKRSPRASDGTLAEVDYIKMLLFDFAGPGFELDAARHAARVLEAGLEAQTAARYLSERLLEAGETAEARKRLEDARAKSTTDIRSYEMMGRLIVLTDNTGDDLAQLGEQGAQLFPSELSPLRFLGLAAVVKRDPKTALEFAEAALKLSPGDLLTLKLMVRIAALDPTDRPLAVRIAQIAADRQISDPVVNAFVALRFGGRVEEPAAAISLLQNLLQYSPRSYPLSLALARQLAATEDDAGLTELAKQLNQEIPGDADAARYHETLLTISDTFRERALFDDAAALLDAANLANPARLELHARRALLLHQSNNQAGAIDELRLACVLAPHNPSLLFQYGELLMTERTDQAEPLIATLLKLRDMAGKSPRFRALLGLIMFRSDDLVQAGNQYELAAKGEPENLEYRYQLGLMRYLKGRDGEARRALVSLPLDSEYGKKARPILEALSQDK
ncbi:MAG: tetratricopeptide repeat protein [Planctomycetota bacterium]